MNTPRSKQPARWEEPKLNEAMPAGRYVRGLWNDEYCKVVGQITTYWTIVEDQMIDILDELMGGGPQVPVRQIFRSIASNRARIQLLTNVLEKARINRDKNTFYDDVIDRFDKLNRRRNKYVHGLWQTCLEDNSVYFSKETAVDFHFGRAREVSIDELTALMDEMEQLGRDLQKRQLDQAAQQMQ